MSDERVFGCDVSMIDEAIEKWLSRFHRNSTKDMAFSMLSDVQELVSMGACRETIRKKLNRVKYVLDYEGRIERAKEVEA